MARLTRRLPRTGAAVLHARTKGYLDAVAMWGDRDCGYQRRRSATRSEGAAAWIGLAIR